MLGLVAFSKVRGACSVARISHGMHMANVRMVLATALACASLRCCAAEAWVGAVIERLVCHFALVCALFAQTLLLSGLSTSFLGLDRGRSPVGPRASLGIANELVCATVVRATIDAVCRFCLRR